MGRTRSAAPARRRAAASHAPHAPRRVSGPVRPGRPHPITAVPPRLPVSAPAPGTGVADRLRALPDHRLLDALLRSRAWIWLLGLGLGGIVAMQVSLLEMNAGIGRAVQASSALQHRNAELEEQVAELSGGARVSAAATDMGLIAPAPGDVGYLTARPELDALRAAQNMTPPSASARERLASGGAPLAAAAPVTEPVAVTADPAATAAPAPAATPTPAPVAAQPPTTATGVPDGQAAGAVVAPTG